jgi:hypothetical protein
LFLEDGVAYKVILTPLNGSPITHDNVLCPISLPYTQTTEEASASVTPTDFSYPPGDMRRYGADSTGAADASSAFETALSVGLEHYVAPGEYLISTPVNIETSNFTLDIDKFTTASAIECFVVGENNQGVGSADSANKRVQDVIINVGFATGISGSKAFNVKNMRDLEIKANLEDFEYGVYCTPRSGTAWSLPDRCTLKLRTFNVDYPVYHPEGTTDASDDFSASNDWTITECYLQAALTNIHMEQAGGISISDCFLFQNPAVSSGRTQNIFMSRPKRLQMSNVWCFEAGTHGIEIEGGQWISLANVHIPWSGELSASNGLYIHEEAVNSEAPRYINISNVHAEQCSKHGIHIDGADFVNFDVQVRACSNEVKLGGPSLTDTYNGVHIESSRFFTGRALITSGGQHKYDLDVATSNQTGAVSLVSAGPAATADVNQDTVNVIVDAPHLRNAELITTGRTVLAGESGKTFYLNAAGGFTLTLPPPTRDLKYQFAITINPTSNYVITTDSGDNVMQGSYLDAASPLLHVPINNQDTFNFVANTALKGDSVTFHADGTNWHVRGFSKADGGITTSVT